MASFFKQGEKEYPVMEWYQNQFVENCEVLIGLATMCVHKIILDSDEVVYVVPEEIIFNNGKLINK